MRSLSAILLALVALLVIGCKGSESTDATTTTGSANPSPVTKNDSSSEHATPEATAVGKYGGLFTPPAGKENDAQTKMAQEMAKSMVLEVKDDKSFTLTVTVGGKAHLVEGQWTMTGDTLSLKADKIDGKDKEAGMKEGTSAEQYDKPKDYILAGDMLKEKDPENAATGEFSLKKLP